MRRLMFVFFLIPLLANAQHWNSDTVHLYFPMDQRTLPHGVQLQLDELAYDGAIGSGSHIVVIGYADYVGESPYNDKLSLDRARAVAKYLRFYGVRDSNVVLLQGRGEVDRPGMTARSGNQRDRRVDLVLNAKLPPPQPAPEPPVAVAPPPPAPKKIDRIAELRENETLVLENLYFYPGRHTLRPESGPVLTELYQILRKHPTLRIRIEGHICCITRTPDARDEDSGDDYLSVNRARYIHNWLVTKGISAKRLEFEGYGRTRPIIANEVTEDDANQNRRVEVRVLSR